MTARCPQCQTLYRVAREKLGPNGARLRCTRCRTVFRVEPPAEPPAATIEGLERVEPPPPPVRPVRVRALVAESDPAVAKRIAELLERWSLDVSLVDDGAEALLAIFRTRPPLAVLGGHLPGIGAPAIAEVARRAGIEGVRTIRVAPLDEPVGAPEFDADATLEPGDLADGLVPLLERFGLGERPVPEPAPPEPVAPSSPAPSAARTTAPAQVPAPGGSEAEEPSKEVAAAERLARIAVSDIVLYNEEKFRQAAAAGKLPGALEVELDEARHMFRERVPDEIRATRDFLVEELMRRASKVA